jgi:hypothetical protein
MAETRGGSTGRRLPAGGRKDTRTLKRAKARVMCRFGANGVEHTAFTKNVSSDGMFLGTNSVLPPGTTIQLMVQFPDRKFTFWATVAWAKKVPPQLAHILECGMGVRFIDPGPEWLAYHEKWKRKFLV